MSRCTCVFHDGYEEETCQYHGQMYDRITDLKRQLAEAQDKIKRLEARGIEGLKHDLAAKALKVLHDAAIGTSATAPESPDNPESPTE